LKNSHPDILVIGDNESVVVEVKTTKGNSNNLKEYEHIAKVISEHEGWRFELVFTNPRETFIHNEIINELPKSKILKIIDEVKVLIKNEHLVASFLLGWSALEGAIRLKLETEKADSLNKSTLSIIKTLYSFGFVNHSQYKQLETLNKTRNSLIHGFDHILSKKTVEELLDLILYLSDEDNTSKMNNWLDGLDLDGYEEIYQLYTCVKNRENYGLFTFEDDKRIEIGCNYISSRLKLETEAEYNKFLLLIEQEFMDDMDPESWYSFQHAINKDD
jgi:hypothetical protein